MINYEGTYNQIVKKAGTSFGGALVVFEGHPQLLVGGFNYDLDDLPPAGVVMPCGTPVYCDEAERTITPLVTVKVKTVGTGRTLILEDNGFGATPLKVGDTIGRIPSDLSSAVAENDFSGEVTAVDGNTITVSTSTSVLTAGDILVQINATSRKVKVIPNAITPYDVVRSADAVSVDGDGMIGNDRPLLERRMPPYNDALKAAVQANGHKLTFSNRK